MNPELQNKTGFTLIEIIIAVAIIAMLATILISVATVIDTQSKEKATEATFALLEGALDEYKDFINDFPEANDLDPYENCETLYAALDSIPASRNILQKIDSKLIQNKYEPADPNYEIYDLWGTVLDYWYEPDDTYPLLRSAGKDKMFSTPDDISNE